jgi:hypothetical protein
LSCFPLWFSVHLSPFKAVGNSERQILWKSGIFYHTVELALTLKKRKGGDHAANLGLGRLPR